ncbi:hypothetical protein [Streptomyces sp. BRA346]|uniref:hypothetical protein n=1 Tax=Streptomyces sp. BRA346 TaxID=2878199 RepID=UPI00406445B7
MNGYEHYKRAEELIAEATRTVINSAGVPICIVSDEREAVLVNRAQVHATLALAAAQADATRFKRDLYEGNGEEPPGSRQARTEEKNQRLAESAAAFVD